MEPSTLNFMKAAVEEPSESRSVTKRRKLDIRKHLKKPQNKDSSTKFNYQGN